MTKVLLATSEAVPLVKTGGLADVCGSLPMAIAQEGCETTLILPAYRKALESMLESGTHVSGPPVAFEVPIGNKVVSGAFHLTTLPGTKVKTILVVQPEYFDRKELYTEDGIDYRDNCERFIFFSRAILEAIRLLNLDVDLIHCNDWQTALVPVYLENEYRGAAGYEHLATLLTIHNLAYQGRFWHWDMLLTGLDWKLFNWKQLEFFGDLNFLKGGITFANSISTVSPRYATEIQSDEFGFGLQGSLRNRNQQLSGILNGVDYETWNPASDHHIGTSYSNKDWQTGKAECKAALQAEMGLPVDPKTPVIGFVGRLTEQKGVDLLARLISAWVKSDNLQWVILGTGESKYEAELTALANTYPHRVATKIAFSEAVAHRIVAGSDLFFMPSRFEPCGLTQFYSLKYGTLPLVHATGGLFDSICETPESRRERQNGFLFSEFNDAACESALDRAITLYRESPKAWSEIVENAMSQDWSWTRSAKAYVALYRNTIERVRQTVCA